MLIVNLDWFQQETVKFVSFVHVKAGQHASTHTSHHLCSQTCWCTLSFWAHVCGIDRGNQLARNSVFSELATSVLAERHKNTDAFHCRCTAVHCSATMLYVEETSLQKHCDHSNQSYPSRTSWKQNMNHIGSRLYDLVTSQIYDTKC
jgi:hypothetical protein